MLLIDQLPHRLFWLLHILGCSQKAEELHKGYPSYLYLHITETHMQHVTGFTTIEQRVLSPVTKTFIFGSLGKLSLPQKAPKNNNLN